MVSPFVDETGRAKGPVNEDVLFFKRGLDLRLMEFDEDCRRIKVGLGNLSNGLSCFAVLNKGECIDDNCMNVKLQITEQTLQRRLDDLALGYDAMVMEAHGKNRAVASLVF